MKMKTSFEILPVKQIQTGLFIAILALAFGACQNESRGFVLPQGDVATGAMLFSDFNCTRCHSIGDIEWMGSESNGDPHIVLGGEVTSLKTYGELVTSVINPSHKISQQHLTAQRLTRADGTSKMEKYKYNEVMTVQELIDLIAYLQSEYKLIEPVYPHSYQPF